MSESIDIPSSELPLMVYDGECLFCRATIDRWREATGQEIRFASYQEFAAHFPQVGNIDFQRAVHFIDTDGTVSRGAEAIFRAMAHCRRKRWLLWLYLVLPPFAVVAEFFYGLIAANRTPISTIYAIWRGKDLKRPTFFISSALFLWLLGFAYLIAFASLWTQVDGLIGDRGILPTKDFLDAANGYFAHQIPPASPIWNLPTLAWISPHDASLNSLCVGGMLLSVLLILGVLPIPTLILLWLFYLSLVHVGQVFLSFQWDILLLETGFIAIFVAPFGLRSRFLKDRHPPRLVIWLVWWLLFRLMFESGAVKLTWNNWQLGPDGLPVANTWSSLTALDYHYWTQPLPIWTSWYAAKLPAWFQKLSVVFVFIVELGLPWCIFAPRRLRYVAFGGITLLMFLISVTGNYNFFNLLTFVLALTLLDDSIWPRSLRDRITGVDYPLLASPTRWRSFLLVPFAGLALVIGALQIKEAAAPARVPPPSIESKLDISQFLLVNDYGLFRQMTETRPELVVEGSVDGKDWKAYGFRWKPGDPARPPRFAAPHQPRLDWQMWFEALRLEQVYSLTGSIDFRDMSPWFQSFLVRLATGETAVIDLLETNPFSNAPPRFVRIVLYRYRFTTSAERRKTGNWWHREQVWVAPGWSLRN